MFKIKVAYSHHMDGFVIAPKHIVADDDRVHGRFYAIRGIPRSAFWQVR